MRTRCWLLLGLAAGTLVLPGTGTGAGWSASERAQLAGSDRVDAALVEALDAADEARVIVALAKPTPRDRRARARVADAVLADVGPADLRLVHRYRELSALAGQVTRRGLLRLLARTDVLAVALDRPITALLGESVPLVGLDVLHVAGHTGVGQAVALIDTGVDADHEDLLGAVVAQQCYCAGADGAGPVGCCPNGLDSQTGAGAAEDDHGHGTRVGGIVTSDGISAPLGGAPDAALVAIKVLAADGTGSYEDLIKALDWILAYAPYVDVVNLSLGGLPIRPGVCDDEDAIQIALAEATGELRSHGVPTFAGTGNNKSGAGMLSPACISHVISVSAVWDEALGSQTWFACTDADTQPDQVTCFGNSGPETDLFAPGALIESSRLNGGTNSRAGTSYATPMAAACAAVLLAAYPGLAPDALQAALEGSPTQVTDPKNGLSFPRLDCAAALASVRTAPALPWAGVAVLAGLLLTVARRALS